MRCLLADRAACPKLRVLSHFQCSSTALQREHSCAATRRKNRGALIRVALVGYTNVGKSTLMNVVSKSKVFAENKLFATLDTTVRKVVLGNLPFLLSDTVGFIRKLPTQLVESFKSTLDEVREADLLLHIVDISHPNFEEHIASVNQILGEIGCADKRTITVFEFCNRSIRAFVVEGTGPKVPIRCSWNACFMEESPDQGCARLR